MLRPGSFRCSTTQSMAAITWVTSAAPAASPALTLMMGASGATARKLGGSAADAEGGGVAVGPVGRRRVEGDVHPVKQLVGAGKARDVRYAGVHDGHVHALAGVAGAPEVPGASASVTWLSVVVRGSAAE